jgi:hypothetical protein
VDSPLFPPPFYSTYSSFYFRHLIFPAIPSHAVPRSSHSAAARYCHPSSGGSWNEIYIEEATKIPSVNIVSAF